MSNAAHKLSGKLSRPQKGETEEPASAESLQESIQLNQKILAEINEKLDRFNEKFEARVSPPPAALEALAQGMPEPIRNFLKKQQLARDIAYLRKSNLFDPIQYAITYPDVASSGIDPATHFVTHGEIEGRSPSATYKTERHLKNAAAYRKLVLTGSYYVEYLRMLQKQLGGGDSLENTLGSQIGGEAGGLFKGISPKRYEGPDKMEVLFIGHDASMSGAPIILLELVEELTQKYPVNAKIVLQLGGPLREKYEKLAPVVVLSELNLETGGSKISTQLICDSFSRLPGPKFVVANTADISLDFCRLFSAVHIPFYSWIHEMPDCIERYFGGQEKMNFISKHSTALVFGGSLSYRDNLARFKLKKDNAKVIEWGINLQKDEGDAKKYRDQVRTELGIPLDAQLVLGCGTVVHRKGPDLYVQVAKAYNSELNGAKPVHFLWVGPTPSVDYSGDILADVKKAGLEDLVHFIGERKNSHPYFKACDAFLMTSRRDTRPLVALEAIGYKLPVIGFEDATGSAEYTAKGYGSMVPYLETHAMADELRAYLTKQKTIKDDGDRFIREEIAPGHYAEMWAQEFKMALNPELAKSGKTILVISAGCPPLCGHRAEGGGLRTWGIARTLKQLLPDYEVTLAYIYKLESEITDGHYEGVFVTEWSTDNLRDLVGKFSTVIMSYCMGDYSKTVTEWLDHHQQLVLDCYVPIYVEICARKSDSVQREYDTMMKDIANFNDTLKRGDIFLCANTPQLDFYRGVLSALGRVNPKTYDDMGLRIVPYGIDAGLPVAKAQPIKVLAGPANEKAWKLLWFGAIYPWFNIEILLDAIYFLNQKHPTQLVMVGAKNPFNSHPDFIDKAKQVQSLVAQDKFREIVHMHDWVPFEDRADWYLDCDLIVTLNEPGIENGLSWRTRVADYVWAGMPIASNGGDPLTEDLISHGAAGRLDIGNAKALTESLYAILADEPRRKSMKAQMELYRPKLHWKNVVKPLREAIECHNLAADRIS